MFVDAKSRRKDKQRVANSLKSMGTVTVPEGAFRDGEKFSQMKRAVRRSRRRTVKPHRG